VVGMSSFGLGCLCHSDCSIRSCADDSIEYVPDVSFTRNVDGQRRDGCIVDYLNGDAITVIHAWLSIHLRHFGRNRQQAKRAHRQHEVSKHHAELIENRSRPLEAHRVGTYQFNFGRTLGDCAHKRTVRAIGDTIICHTSHSTLPPFPLKQGPNTHA
jgi:hypothetical protein